MVSYRAWYLIPARYIPATYQVYFLPYIKCTFLPYTLYTSCPIPSIITALYNLFFLLYTSYTSCPIPGIFPAPYKEDVYYLVMSFFTSFATYNSCLVLIIKIHLSIYISFCLINVWFGLKPAGPRIKKNLGFYLLFRLILPVEQNINHF